jgi:probable phosphoglycerate mutase
MLEIYFVRHGETDWNTKKILQGKQNSNLTAEGIEQAKKLGKKLKTTQFDKVYSSPLKRAMDTTKYILGDKKQEIIPIPEFEEIGLGAVEGIQKEEFEGKYPKEYNDFWTFSIEYNPSSFGGETFSELFQRLKAGLDKLICENPEGGKVLVVCHGFALKSLFCIVKGFGIEALPTEPIPENTSLSIINYTRDNGFNIEVFSDTSHL